MKTIKIQSEIRVYPDVSALPPDVQQLMKQASAARTQAYAPYSRFCVGAAVEMVSGEVVTGSNQENASYPSGLCAERVAIFQAGALYPTKAVRRIAITAATEKYPVNQPIPPCGACRQSIAEYESRQDTPIAIYFMGERGEVWQTESLESLLPLIFSAANLSGQP